MAFQAVFPSPAGLNSLAHSTPASAVEPASGPVPAQRDGLPVPALDARAHGFVAQANRLDTAAPAAAVDLKEVPGQFCLWILMYSGHVSGVVSFGFQHLH